MDKTKIFMAVTAFISIVCFNFNKIITAVIGWVNLNMYDHSIYSWGPYQRSLPVVIREAYVNGTLSTNKVELLLNWRWDFDMNGISGSDLALLGDDIVIVYYCKYLTQPNITTCHIDLKNKTVNIDNTQKRIVFDEVKLCLN